MSSSSTNTLGKYQIIREIARSNDVVYEAIDPSINRRIALKELSIPANLQGAQKRERIERFWREGKAAGKLSHPNIVTIFEVGKDGDRHFIAMEFLEGQTLRDVIQARGPLPIQDARNYALQLCSALAYAHRNGVIHRDIKPENVQILPGGHVKLTDFGIARLMGEPSITQNGQVFGTPSYMSPEQVAGRELDARSDIFSMGVLLYEMVAGHKPFTGDSVVTITYNIMNMEPPPPPGAPPWVTGVVRKAMAKDAGGRYASADEMAEDIREERSANGFAFDPTGAGTSSWPSPFGGAPPQQAPQQPQGPLTPYGTPMPSPDPFSTGTAAPDPFSQAPPSAPMPPPVPPRPVLSSETRNFLGVFMLIIGFAGLLVFAIWSINLAYQSYVTAQTSGSAERYLQQGNELYQRGDVIAAEQQFLNAIRVSPQSKAAEAAKDGLYSVWELRAYRHAGSNESDPLLELAQRMIELRPRAPEGHYYLAYSLELRGDRAGAKREYEQASDLAGVDEEGYGAAARARLEQLAASEPPPPEPSQPELRPNPPDNSGIPFEPSSPQ